MSCNLSHIKGFLLDYYVEQINKFVGKEVLKKPDKDEWCSLDVFDFLADLCDAINRHKWQVHCIRKCPFRKQQEEK